MAVSVVAGLAEPGGLAIGRPELEPGPAAPATSDGTPTSGGLTIFSERWDAISERVGLGRTQKEAAEFRKARSEIALLLRRRKDYSEFRKACWDGPLHLG